MRHETHPREAFQLQGSTSVEVGSNGADAKSFPIRLVARSGQPIIHPYWGKITHDLEGFSIPGGRNRISLDYVHDEREVIGYANRFDYSSGDLVLTGALTPWKDNDRAAEIQFKSAQGVPYEASINFAGDKTVFEYVDEGEAAEVNGYEFTGPGVIVRQWELRSCAVCPSGADSSTSVELFSTDDKVTVQIMEPEDMAHEEKQVPQDEQENIKADEAQAVDAVEGDEDSDESTVEVILEIDDEVDVESQEPELATSLSIEEGQRMAAAFGERGAYAFLKGQTYDDVQAEILAELQAENEKLREQLSQRESTPASFSAADGFDSSKTSKMPFRLAK